MKSVNNNRFRSPEVKKLLNKKIGFFLSKGNSMVLIAVLLGIVASSKLEYQLYSPIKLVAKENHYSDRVRQEIMIKVSNETKYKIKEGDILFKKKKIGLMEEFGRIRTQILRDRDSTFYEIDFFENHKLSHTEYFMSEEMFFLKIGRTSLFNDFLTQFEKSAKYKTGLNQIELRDK